LSEPVSRRDFLAASTVSLAATGIPGTRSLFPAPAVVVPPPAHPVAVASLNGLRGVAKAAELMASGADTLDAAVEGVKIQELDPNDNSVGYGVAALEGIKTPSEVAKLVLKYTTHILLVGEGAKRFALSYGFKEEDLLTPESRQAWLTWRANRGHDDDWVDVSDNEPMVVRPTGTINLNLVNTKGDISSVTTTAGLAWKIPGRIGDSPIVGAGQYTDNDIGAAGSTGLGEANIMVCGAFLTVEHMRRGMKPTDFYAVNKRGEFGAASLYPTSYAVHDGKDAAARDAAHLFDKAP
jgi:N4-(beta-N-acetylglucosaminyl)-L-asparaginase